MWLSAAIPYDHRPSEGSWSMSSTKPSGGDLKFVHPNSVLPKTACSRWFVSVRGCAPLRANRHSELRGLRTLRTGHFRHSHLVCDQTFTLWRNDTFQGSSGSQVNRKSLPFDVFDCLSTSAPSLPANRTTRTQT